MQPDSQSQSFPPPTSQPASVEAPVISPVSMTPSDPPQTQQVPVATSSMEYAGVWTRFFAVLIDGIILGMFSGVFNLIIRLSTVASASGAGPNPAVAGIFIVISLVVWVVNIAYPIYFIGSRGQTLGKIAMKIKVVNSETGEVPGYLTAFLREIVGKFISGLAFGIGYFTAFGDPKKQAWHDKIAKTVVIKA